jgi:hypothetical protein
MTKQTLTAILVAVAIGGSAAILAQGRGGRAGWVTIKEGEECPPGTTEARHLQGAPPASPPPPILDYRNYHAFWKLYGMALPDAILKKLYYKNALRIEPGLPQSGWPQ